MAQRVVAFLDVLGFKSLVEAVPHTQLLEAYRELQLAARQQTARAVFPEDPRRFDADAYYDDKEIRWARVANVVVTSDSIIVYSQGDSSSDSMAVAAAVRGLLVEGFRHGMPMRGAICIGDIDELELDDNAVDGTEWTARFAGLVGLGIVRAYELESRSNWSGAVVQQDLIDHLAQLGHRDSRGWGFHRPRSRMQQSADPTNVRSLERPVGPQIMGSQLAISRGVCR